MNKKKKKPADSVSPLAEDAAKALDALKRVPPSPEADPEESSRIILETASETPSEEAQEDDKVELVLKPKVVEDDEGDHGRDS